MELIFYVGKSHTTINHETNKEGLIEVFLQEYFPGYIGNSAQVATVEFKCKNLAKGQEDLKPLQVGLTVPATYAGPLYGGLPPTLHLGERVMVVTVKDTEDYRWFALHQDHHLRTREVVDLLVANKSDTENAVTEENAYSVKVDTRKGTKCVDIRTSKNDGEFAAYNFRIDPVAGTCVLRDDLGNMIGFDSRIPEIKLVNSKGVTMSAVNGEFIIKSPKITLDGDVLITGNARFQGDVAANKTVRAAGYIVWPDGYVPIEGEI